MTTERSSPLEDLRTEIGEIDEAMHDLLMRRTDRVVAMAQSRAGETVLASAVSPGREASLLRRIAARHKGPLDIASALSIWRQIIAVKLFLQTPFTLAIVDGKDVTGTLDLARGHFGVTPPLEAFETVSQVLDSCARAPNMIGLLPVPGPGIEGGAWWRQLPPPSAASPRVVARLPFFPGAGGLGEGQGAYVVASVPPEPSGDDTTLMVMEEQADVSRARLLSMLDQAGLPSTVLDVNEGKKPAPDVFLLAVKGFVTADDPRLATFATAAAGFVGYVKIIGAYPNPISV